MSKIIAPPLHISNVQPIEVTPIDASANLHAPPAGRVDSAATLAGTAPISDADADADAPYRRTLKSLDKHFGPLRIGEVLTSRVELQALGATVNGQPISPANAGMPIPDQTFLDGLNFHSASVESRLKSVDIPDSGVVAMLFYEIACKRSPDAMPLFVSDTPLASGSAMEQLNRLGQAAQKLDIHRADSFDNAPGWVNGRASYLMNGFGVGLQAFGVYSGFMGVLDGIKKGDAGEAIFQGASIAAEFGSLIIEQGFNKGGEAMLRHGSTTFKLFPGTSAGKFLSRGAGLFASAITLPFDIIDAVKSFNAAAQAEGKEAQDHYVNASVSVAGAGISLVLGVAAIAGFGSTAGPVGLVAAAVLIFGSMIYSAARVVDDIDDYIELSTLERLRSGWFAFTGKDLDKEVMDRFKLSKGYRDHQAQLEMSAKELLDGAYKNAIEHIVDGAFKTELKTVELWRYQWDESAGEKPFKLDSQAVIVGADDVIDASNGLPEDLKGKVSGTAGDDKGVFWRLGDGNDRVIGVKAKPNLFAYREGHKALTGGDKNDAFYQAVTEQELDRLTKPPHISVLDGGAGSDTLVFEGSRPLSDTRHVGHDIDLQSGQMKLRRLDAAVDAVEVAHLTSIENVSTLRKGTSHVTGNDDANRVAANGYDRISTGGGNDRIDIFGPDCHVDGGSGADHYYIADTNARTTIVEDGEQSSVIELGWPREIIQRWEIVGTSLIVSSLRDRDGRDPLHVLTIKDLYESIDGQRQLKNGRWLFKTQDGYELLPLLPQQLGESLSQAIEVAQTVKGRPAPDADIVNHGTVVITEQGSKRHFVSRADGRVEFLAARHTPHTSREVYLDFKDSEIVEVVVSYDVETRKGVSGNTHLIYKDINLSILLPSKVVVFKGIIQPITAATGYSGRNSLKVTTPRLVQDIAVILQDQVSYRLQVPSLNYEDDSRNPGNRIYTTRSCLKRRNGNYLCIQPRLAKAIALPPAPRKIVIEPRPHTGIYLLQGQSSSYDVYLASNSIIRLSTPQAAAGTADASTWTLYSETLTETVTRDDIRLDSNRLRVGSCVIELPGIEGDIAVESISVATSSGNIYEVSLLFEVIQLYVIDARHYSSIEALQADIRAHQQRNELAVKVHITNIGFKTGTIGTVYYSSLRNGWGVDTDPHQPIKPEELTIAPIGQA
ncbi:calcium-binding protein [Pseudomonas sp. RL_35y_Pfl2_P42]|uniref:calcium-binding protein n=1 Tax=Pseudomonas sp. RL_35y_Pfl2_P42 TaxID=3088710 RepID=UPI0030D894E3